MRSVHERSRKNCREELRRIAGPSRSRAARFSYRGSVEMANRVYDRVRDIVGEKNVSEDFFELVNNTIDAFPYELDPEKEPLPIAVVKPANEKEISEIFPSIREGPARVSPARRERHTVALC
jgi:hypothetical protein